MCVPTMISYALQPPGAGPFGTGFPPNPFGTCGAAITNGRMPARIAIVDFMLENSGEKRVDGKHRNCIEPAGQRFMECAIFMYIDINIYNISSDVRISIKNI